MANIAFSQALPSGAAVTGTAATAGPDNLTPGDAGAGAYLLVDNASGSSVTITIADPGKSAYQVANGPLTFTVAAGTKKVAGPFRGDLAQSDGFIDVTASPSASVTFYSWRA